MLPGSECSRRTTLWYSDKSACSCQPPRFPCTLLTWQWLTDLTAFSREALRTVAAIAVTFLQTAPSVETGVRLARVLLHCKDRQSGREWEAFKGVISVHYGKKQLCMFIHYKRQRARIMPLYFPSACRCLTEMAFELTRSSHGPKRSGCCLVKRNCRATCFHGGSQHSHTAGL